MKKSKQLRTVLILLVIVLMGYFIYFNTRKDVGISQYNIFQDSSNRNNYTNWILSKRVIGYKNGSPIVDSTVMAYFIFEGIFKRDTTSIKKYVLNFFDTAKLGFPVPSPNNGQLYIYFYKTSFTKSKDIIPDEYNTNLNEDLVAELWCTNYSYLFINYGSGPSERVVYEIEFDRQKGKILSIKRDLYLDSVRRGYFSIPTQ